MLDIKIFTDIKQCVRIPQVAAQNRPFKSMQMLPEFGETGLRRRTE